MGHFREDFTDKVYIKDLIQTKGTAINAFEDAIKKHKNKKE